LLLLGYGVYVYFQTRTHHGIYDAIFELDEERDQDKEHNAAKAKLTMTESVVALVFSITLVTLIALTLVEQIEPVIENGDVTDPFMGLIIVPFIEKFAEHLTAVDEAFDDQMNLAISHVLGATLQTAFFNGPIVVLVGWGLHKKMDLSFELFDIVMLILAILTVGRFLQDQKSNYLEGSLLVLLYAAIAVSAFYYDIVPPPTGGTGETS
jgi:Ca2+:H+ antiporter